MKTILYSSARELGDYSIPKLLQRLRDNRELIIRLVKRDINVRYRQSVLGYVWALLPQIATVAIFSFLASRRIFPMGDSDLPYIVHALLSVSGRQLFSVILVNCTNSLVHAGALVTKVNFAKESLVFAAVGVPVLDFLIRLAPVVLVFVWLGFVPSSSSILIPLALIPIILLALGLGLLFSILNLLVRDIGNALSMALTFGIFVAPILYPPPVTAPYNLVNILNPFSPMLITTQNLLSGAPLQLPWMLLLTSALSILVFFAGWKVFCITMPRIAERA